MWQNSAHTLLERTLDDSANRRAVLPSSFLATDEVLITSIKVVKNMNIHSTAIERNMETYGIFAASERLLMELGRNGANRQEMHEVIREHSLKAWAEIQEGKANTLKDDLINDPVILKFVNKEKAIELLNADEYVGDAPFRTTLVINEAYKVL